RKNNPKKKGDEEVSSKQSDILDVSDLNIEGVKTISRKMFTKIIEARVSEIFSLVKQNITNAGYSYQLPAGVVVTGGSANLPGITAIAKESFGVPARIGKPRGLEGLTD